MPDVKKKILSTRALDQEVISKARVQGIWIDCIPFIDIRYKSEKDIAGQFKDISESDIFIFTSQHAVKAAYELIKNLSNSSYCISGVTRQEVQQTRLKILANADYASDLVLLMERNSDLQYILFCGDKRLPTIPDFFIAQKLHLQEVVCYENIASPQRVTEQYDSHFAFTNTSFINASPSYLLPCRISSTSPRSNTGSIANLCRLSSSRFSKSTSQKILL